MTDFAELGAAIGRKTAEKNKAYGDAVGKTGAIFRILFPDGIPVSSYEDTLLIVRLLDKIVRIACGDKSAFEESPYRDIAGYGLIGSGRETAMPNRQALCCCSTSSGGNTYYCPHHGLVQRG